MGNPIVMAEFRVVDFRKLKHFYSTLFDWEIEEPNEFSWAEIKTGNDRGAQGAMVVVDTLPPGHRGSFFYVEVKELQETLQRAVELGATVVVEPWEEVGLAIFTDPEGNRVGLLRARNGS